MQEIQKIRALLISVFSRPSDRDLCVSHLEELALLAETEGVAVVEKIPCHVKEFDAATFVSAGKLEELLDKARELSVDLIVFDEEISPTQQRNLEKLFSKPVIDRTQVILDVFARRAHTREAQLQVELAQTEYLLPRLKRMWTHLSRQTATGGGAYLKGKGEKQIELDRRQIKRRIQQLHKEIGEVKAHRETQRGARLRSEIPVFALIGYTNSGKSTLLNALTGSHVFVEDKLFATLDTTTRKLSLKNNQEILLTDTVGFIRKLPHLLVAAFKSTLEEAIQADVLLHLIDVSHPMAEEQAAASLEVLKELGAEKKPIITLLNKTDACHDPMRIGRLRFQYPKTVLISALKQENFDSLEEKMMEVLKDLRQEVILRIPQSEYDLVSLIIRQGQVVHQAYEDNDVVLEAEVPVALMGRLKKYVIS